MRSPLSQFFEKVFIRCREHVHPPMAFLACENRQFGQLAIIIKKMQVQCMAVIKKLTPHPENCSLQRVSNRDK